MSNDTTTQIQSVVYEMPQFGLKVIPFDASKSIKDFRDVHPESSYIVFSMRSIEEIANINEKLISWISPERKITETDFNENIAELNVYLKEKLISSKRHELFVSALTTILHKQQ